MNGFGIGAGVGGGVGGVGGVGAIGAGVGKVGVHCDPSTQPVPVLLSSHE